MAIALPAWLLAAQMTMEIATASLVLIDMLVNPFMADRYAFLPRQPTADLLRAPVLPKQLLHTCPGRFRYPRSVPLFLAVLRQPVGLFGTVAFQSLVPSQFPADGRGIAPQNLSDFFLAVTRFPQRIDLVSFISGKLRVASHRAPLSWWIELSRDATAAYSTALDRVALTS